MGVSFVQAGQSPAELLRLLATNSATALQVKAFFAPRCDCDVVQYVKDAINANNELIKGPIRAAIIKPYISDPPVNVSKILGASGDTLFMIRSWCEGLVRKGEFINADGILTTQTVMASDAGCAPITS